MNELPIGFAFSLSMNKNAMDYYSTLDLDTQNKLTNYIQDAKTGDEAKLRIEQSINALSNADTNFLFLM